MLALVKVGQMQEAAKAFQWINGQRRMGGGYGSTQVSGTFPPKAIVIVSD